MKESIKMAPMYIAMFGIPVLMFLSLLSYIAYPDAVRLLLLPLIVIGLLSFGILAAREVYGQKYVLQGIPIGGNAYEGEVVDKGRLKDAERHAKQLVINIKRFNTGKGRIGTDSYMIDADRFTTVLEALLHIKTKKDNTLSMRYSCRMGICGSCGMVINGKPALACETNILKNLENGQIEVAPMQGHPILKDLVDDFDEFFGKHLYVEPYLYRKDKKEKYEAKAEYGQTQEDIEQFLPYSYCIMCGLCMDACPIVNTNPSFIGPQPLSQAYRYYADSRDQLGQKRIDRIDILEGIWSCEFAGACSKVCPKGVDPATAIQLLKAEAIKGIVAKK